jgi:DNA repair ATPase RecN
MSEIKPPLSLTPAALEAGDDPAIQVARTSLAEAAHAAQQLAEAINATAADPSLTPAQRALKSSRLSEQLSTVISKRLDDSRNAINHALLVVEGGPAWNPARATSAHAISIERATADALRSMSAEERMSAVNQAIRDDDQTVLAALACGPAFLTGMKNEQRAPFLNAWRAKHSAAWSRHQKLKAAAARVQQAGDSTVAWVRSLQSAGTGLEDLASKAADARAAAEATAKG